MKTFHMNATDDEIKAIVVEWSELLAEGRFAEALAMFPSSNAEMEWTPELLEYWISNYGCPEPYPGDRKHTLTSLSALDNAEEIIRDRIDVDRENLYGLSPEHYVGMVHYDDVPLDGKPSDLTARFHIKKVGSERIALEFLDIHVM